MRSSTLALAAAALLAAPAGSQAIVGGSDVPAGQHKNVAEVGLGGLFGCTGTLVAPGWVMTAGHCGSLTGATGASSPVAWPPQAISVRMGSNKTNKGKLYSVAKVVVPPDYLLTSGHDVSLLQLSAPVPAADDIPATPVAGASERATWEPAVVATIVGWGNTESGGSSPTTLQQAEVPITGDPYCADAYADQADRDATWSGFDTETMVCAGYPEGGIDSCQGDSGGPLFVETATGALRVAGATSYGEGCAEPGFPGIYARVADQVLRTWITAVAPDAVAG